MKNVIKIALRNLTRYQRRTLLTGSLIAMGVILVITFTGVGYSFKRQITDTITNSNVGHLQIHRNGFVSAMDNLPLDMVIQDEEIRKLEAMFQAAPEVDAYSKRLRFAGMLSNYDRTVGVQLIAIIPELEGQTCPELPARIVDGRRNEAAFITRGEMLISESLATGLGLKVGSDVVLVATNKDGSMNGLNLRVGGISENLMGPAGRNAYLHYADAHELLRIEGEETNEVVLKLKNLGALKPVMKGLRTTLASMQTADGQPLFEVHTWEQLSPLSDTTRLVDILVAIIRMVLTGIVLISVMNVMMMSVYERISEIGTIASIGTSPGKILGLFLMEAIALGFLSSLVGSILGVGVVWGLHVLQPAISMGHVLMHLTPTVSVGEVVTPMLMVIVISMLSGLQPALKASRLEPVEALRHV
jgi:putative ABC transport system permease protein